MSGLLERLPRFWWLRVAGVVGALALVLVQRDDAPPGDEVWLWVVLAFFAVETAFVLALGRRERVEAQLAVLMADTLAIGALVWIFEFTRDQPLRSVVYVLIAEAALAFGRLGGVVMAVVVGGVLAGAEWFSGVHYGEPFDGDSIVIRFLVALGIALLAGRLAENVNEQTARSVARAEEAERLRDELGRRVDALEAANRCARALASSLELEEAFGAFVRELGGLVPFDRTALVLAEGTAARVIATAGAGSEAVMPPGSETALEGSAVADALDGRLVYRVDMADSTYPDEEPLVALGLRSRILAPLMVGPRSIGVLALARREPGAFDARELELVTLLGRLVANAVQNIRAYEAERSTVEELRRLSALRADFVSLVSHELRSPMAAVVGASRTLQERWRELSPEQRHSFLELIAGETNRLAALVGDVLDTSRIEAGTFSYRFADVDLAELVRETVATAALGQDEVEIVAEVPGPIPRVRADRERLRQVLTNLIDNAVKYSPAGAAVTVAAVSRNGAVAIEVADRGPGIAAEQQRLIFEKFGRAKGEGGGKPGTGLGLFIARSIAEAHGGTLEVRSSPTAGATFTLTLPL